MSRLEESQIDALPASQAACKPRRRRVLAVLVLLGGAIAGTFGYFAWRPAAPEIPQVNTAGADEEVVAAVEQALAAVRASPRSAAAWGELALVLHANGFDQAADQSYQAVHRLDPRNPDWPYLQGYLHHIGPDGPEKARDCFALAVELSPHHAPAQLRLADMLLALGDFAAAEQHYQQAAQAHADPPLVALGLAKLAVARNQPERALEYLASIADEPLVRKRAGVLRATLLERKGEKEAAEQERQRLAQSPEDRMATGDPVEKVIEREISVRAMISKAQCLWNEKQPRPMVAVMRKAVKRYPDSDAAWSSLATALSATGDLAGSEQALRRCVELAPKTVKYRVSLGKLLTGQKHYDEALQELRTAVQLSPQDGLVHLALGECLLEQGDKEHAAEAFRATLRYLPDDAAAQRYLHELVVEKGGK